MRHTLICTVGTSLFGNLSRILPDESNSVHAALASAYEANNWQQVAVLLHTLDPSERICGAEINSVTDLLDQFFVNCGRLHLLVSDTEDGEAIGAILKKYFQKDGWIADKHTIKGLKDDEPKVFRTRGLRSLARVIGKRVREAGAEFCAIDATGGYKAQIAIAVLMGQALDIPVYYKHERFPVIIRFPPMPVALDSSLWEKASGMFMELSKPDSFEPEMHYSEDWDERFEPLVNRVDLDGEVYLELSATGQIFHETFRERFRRSKNSRLPPNANATDKKGPILGKHGYKQAQAPIQRHLQRVTDERPYVKSCRTTYWNPDLSQRSRFRLSGSKVQGIYSNGSWCAKFHVSTTADGQAELSAVVADLNLWMGSADDQN